MSFPRNELIIGYLPGVSRFSQPKWIVIYLHVTSQSKNWSLPNFQFFGSMTSHKDPHRVKHSWKSSSTSNHGVLGQQIAILLRFPSGFFRRFESVLATGEKGERWTVEKKCTSLYEFVKSKKKRPIDTAQRLVEQQSQIKRDHENTETVVSKKTITQLVH